jgi:hypothetical protein
MYSSFGNQLYHFMHFSLAVAVLMVIFPRLIFVGDTSDHLERLVANFMKMILLLVIMGYLLIATKLFEFISITTILVLLIIHKYQASNTPVEKEQSKEGFSTWLYDYFEGLINLKAIFMQWCLDKKHILLSDYKRIISSVPKMLILILFIAVFVLSGYMRFYDAFHNAPPGMSDGNVTLGWMKYLDARILFHDGFYPQGFYIILDIIFKYADIDALYVLKYAGPLTSLLIELGFYFVVSRFTKNKLAGLVAVIIYGFLGSLYAGSSYTRQAATLSQEYGFIFIFPSLYFYCVYLRTGKKAALWSAAAGTAALGLVHEIGFVLLGIGMGTLLFIYIALVGNQNFRRFLFTAIAGVCTVVITLIPYVMAKLFKVKEHASSSTFLTNQIFDIKSPLLYEKDYIALAAAAIVFMHAFFIKGNRLSKLPYLFASLFTLFTFLIYEYGGYITKLEVIDTRSPDVWILCIPFIIGMSWNSFISILSSFKFKKTLELGFAIAFFIIVIVYVPIKPIIAYKMESNTPVEQYLRIASMYKTSQFLIVSPRVQEYALVLGKGNAMYLETYEPHLINVYDPTKPPLTLFGENKHAPVAADIFIYYEKKIFISEFKSVFDDEKANYERYEKEYAHLQIWIEEYKKAHSTDNSFSIFYEDSAFVVYHLHRDSSRDDVIRNIWS